MPRRKKDYVAQLVYMFSVHTPHQQREVLTKRLLRRLVREAVAHWEMDRYQMAPIDFARHAKRIAREIIP